LVSCSNSPSAVLFILTFRERFLNIYFLVFIVELKKSSQNLDTRFLKLL